MRQESLFFYGKNVYDISFDNGSTWDTGKSIGSEYAYTGSGTEMIVKFNLETTAGGDEVTISNYGIVIS